MSDRAAGGGGRGVGALLDEDLGAVLGDLVEEGHGVVPDVDGLDLQLVVDLGDERALNVNEAAVGLDAALLALAATWSVVGGV